MVNGQISKEVEHIIWTAVKSRVSIEVIRETGWIISTEIGSQLLDVHDRIDRQTIEHAYRRSYVRAGEVSSLLEEKVFLTVLDMVTGEVEDRIGITIDRLIK